LRRPVTISEQGSSSTATATVMDAKVVAGLLRPCLPALCCASPAPQNGTGAKGGGGELRCLEGALPCVNSRYGFQPERFLFRLAPALSLHVPVATVHSKTQRASNLRGHNALSEEEKTAQALRRRHVNDLLQQERVALPAFVKIGCNRLLFE
jgi:hypothetical protein